MKLIDVAVQSRTSDTAERVGSGSELLLKDVDLSDTGTYICNASNSQGSATALATVRVTGWSHSLSPSYGLCLALATYCFL